jgi:hypothetical protein
VREKRPHKWQDAAWKDALVNGARDAIEYFIPNLAADIDHSREITGMRGMELPAPGSGTDAGMRILDVLFSVPVTGGKDRNVVVLTEPHNYDDETFALAMLEKYLRLREQTRKPTTALAIFTDRVKSADSSYNESCYGTELTLKYNTFYVPEHEIDKLRKDNQPFAQVVLAARMALDAGDDVRLREEYAKEILDTVKTRAYGKESMGYILKFSKDIFWLSDDKISGDLKEAYKMTVEMVSLRDYAQEIAWERGREEGIEKGKVETALNFLNMGLSVEQVARGTGFSLEELNKLTSGKLKGNTRL